MARISDANSARMIPSLSVVHTEPSKRRNDAPADSSPPKAIDPSSKPGTNHLKPTGTSFSVRPAAAATLAKEVLDRHREVVVGVHQSGVRGDDAVAIGVGVVARSDVVLGAARDQG